MGCVTGMEDCVTVVSGGDDQAVRVAVFRTCSVKATTPVDGLSTQLALLSSCQVTSAHTSAVRVSKTLLSRLRMV